MVVTLILILNVLMIDGSFKFWKFYGETTIFIANGNSWQKFNTEKCFTCSI